MIDNYINLYGKRLYGLCLTLCTNSAEADDLYQDTWLKVVEHIDKYDQSQKFEPWLTQICVNTYRNMFRRLVRSPIWNGFSSSEEKDLAINSIPAPIAEDHSALHEAIKKLPEKHRVTIILFYFYDMDINATAKMLNVPAGTVKSRLSKAKILLKEALKDEAYIPF